MWAFRKNSKNHGATFQKKNFRTRAGETLVEVLTAFFMLALTASASTGLTIQSYKTSAVYSRNMQARYLARGAIEYVRMILNTNAVRFADPACWDTEFGAKKCTKQSLSPLVSGGTEQHLALVTLKPEDMYFRLVSVKEQANTDPLKDCVQEKTSPNLYALYVKKPALVDANGTSQDPYGNLIYGTDGPAPADQKPVFCRRVTLSKDGDGALNIKVEILSKDMPQAKVFQETLYNENESI